MASGWPRARALVAEGCHVSISARGERALAEAAQALTSSAADGAEVLAVAADLATEAGVARVVDATVERFGGVDVLVNNVALARGGDLLATTDAEWQEAFDQTLFPAIRASAPGRAVDAGARRRRDRDRLVDLRPRSRRPHDLQRRQGGRDQPGQVAGPAAGRATTSA